MAKITSITEHFQHLLADLKERFWDGLEGRTKLSWKHLLESESERMRDRYMVLDSYERGPRPFPDYRNDYYERDFVARFTAIRLRIARTATSGMELSTHEAFKWRNEQGEEKRFFRRVIADSYVISGNCEHGIPHRDTLRWLSQARHGEAVTVYMTNRE